MHDCSVENPKSEKRLDKLLSRVVSKLLTDGLVWEPGQRPRWFEQAVPVYIMLLQFPRSAVVFRVFFSLLGVLLLLLFGIEDEGDIVTAKKYIYNELKLKLIETNTVIVYIRNKAMYQINRSIIIVSYHTMLMNETCFYNYDRTVHKQTNDSLTVPGAVWLRYSKR